MFLESFENFRNHETGPVRPDGSAVTESDAPGLIAESRELPGPMQSADLIALMQRQEVELVGLLAQDATLGSLTGRESERADLRERQHELIGLLRQEAAEMIGLLQQARTSSELQPGFSCGAMSGVSLN